MVDSEEIAAESESDTIESSKSSPLVFISHDSRDSELAEAFGKLLKSVSSNMIKSFRSSDKSGKDGIDFGDEWFKRLMEELQNTSDVVCLFTERSLERPWILFEAGVAKSKMTTPVIGLALGVPLSKVSSGPFYQFQNMDDSEADLKKLLNQLARRFQGLELDTDVVDERIKAFKTTEAELLEKMSTSDENEDSEENSIAKLAEEMKTLPSRVAERLSESGDPYRRKRMRRFHPMMFDEMIAMAGKPGDPVGILMAASMLRDDLPWLYELAMEAYRALKSGKIDEMQRELDRLRKFGNSKRSMMFMEEFGYLNEETHMMSREFPHMLELVLHEAVLEKRSHLKKRTAVDAGDSSSDDET